MKKQGDNLDNVKRELKSQQCSETKLSDEPQVLLRCTCGSLGFTIVQLLVIIAVAIAVYPYSGAILLAQQPATKYDGIISKDNVSVFVVISTHETIGSGKYSTTVEKIFPEFQFTIINSSGKVLDSVTFQIFIKGDGRERFVDFGEKTCSVEGGLPDGQIERFKRDADWLGSNESNRIKNLGEGLCIAYITKINGKKVNEKLKEEEFNNSLEKQLAESVEKGIQDLRAQNPEITVAVLISEFQNKASTDEKQKFAQASTLPEKFAVIFHMTTGKRPEAVNIAKEKDTTIRSAWYFGKKLMKTKK